MEEAPKVIDELLAYRLAQPVVVRQNRPALLGVEEVARTLSQEAVDRVAGHQSRQQEVERHQARHRRCVASEPEEPPWRPPTGVALHVLPSAQFDASMVGTVVAPLNG